MSTKTMKCKECQDTTEVDDKDIQDYYSEQDNKSDLQKCPKCGKRKRFVSAKNEEYADSIKGALDIHVMMKFLIDDGEIIKI